MTEQQYIQGSEIWHRLRKNYIGASEMPVLVNGVHFKKTPYMLWQEKLCLADYSVDNIATRHGNQNEEPAREAYQKATGNLVTPDVVFHPEVDYLMASLDGINASRDLVVEIKNPGPKDHTVAQSGEVPPKYIPQLQAQIACSGVDIAHYWSFREGEGILLEVKKDNKYIDSFYKTADEFWQSVLAFVPPKLNEFDYIPRSGVEWNGDVMELSDVCKQVDELLKRKEEIRKRLIEGGDGKSAKGDGLKITRTFGKGRVDYKKIPELDGVDLDKYRKNPVESFRFTFS